MALGVVKDGNKTVTSAGTRVPLSATSQTMANWLLIQPLAANTGSIYLGGVTVSATSGVVMQSGDSFVIWPSVGFNAYDLSKIYIDAANSSDGVQFMYTSL